MTFDPNRIYRIKIENRPKKESGIELWGLIVTAAIAAGSAAISAWGAWATAEQAGLAREALTRDSINSSNTEYVKTLGQFCHSIDYSEDQYTYTLSRSEIDGNVTVTVRPLLPDAPRVDSFAMKTVDPKVKNALIESLEATRLWTPDKFDTLSKITSAVIRTASIGFDSAKPYRAPIIAYGYCRYMQEQAISWLISGVEPEIEGRRIITMLNIPDELMPLTK